ncbi:hypothetical protein BJV82DRAFT_634007 [Fennellomyces sp. T-0311]|nr:hypothetical protein BJV82DRAFT_634007 [Fennellomyces sp. T-0311]
MQETLLFSLLIVFFFDRRLRSRVGILSYSLGIRQCACSDARCTITYQAFTGFGKPRQKRKNGFTCVLDSSWETHSL